MKTRISKNLTAVLLAMLLLLSLIPASLADDGQNDPTASTPVASDGGSGDTATNPPAATDDGSGDTSTLGSDITTMGKIDSDPTHFTTADVTGGVEITKYTGSSAQVAVPSQINGKTVVGIGNSAFLNNINITGVSMPNTVTYIASSAFSGCVKLTSVTLSTMLNTIGNNAFEQDGLQSVQIPASVTTIGTNVFKDCASLASAAFLGNLDSMPEGIFWGDTSLTSVTLPGNCKSINQFAFQQSGLTSVNLPASLTDIGFNAFNSCPHLASVTFPAGLKTIGEAVFAGCSVLNNVVLPASLNSLGDQSFGDCSGLTSITFADNIKLDSIGYNEFYSDPFTSITLPDSVTSIGIYAFGGCHNLQNITLPENVDTIGDTAFESCTGLGRIKILNDTVSFGTDVFLNDNHLNDDGCGICCFGNSTADTYANAHGLQTQTLHTVTFHPNGGSSVADQIVVNGDPIVSPATTKTGSVLYGWYSDSGLTTLWDFSTGVTGDVDLYAKWVAPHTVTFQSNSGSSVPDQTVGDGMKVIKPADPTRSGYTFDAWYKESGCTNKWDFNSDTVTGDITLYANWQKSSTYLTNITLTSGAEFTHVFSKTRYTYNVILTEDTGGVTITPVLANSHATITINNVVQPDIALYFPDKGKSQTVKIKVTMNGISSHTYTLTVTRAASSYNQLYNISYNAGISDKSFDPSEHNYIVTLGESESMDSGVTITPVQDTSNPDYSLEKIYIDGKKITSKPYNMDTGHYKTCKIKVVAQDGSYTTYTVMIKRAPSTDDYLKGLKTNLSKYPIVAFDKDTLDYTVNLPDSVSSVTLYATKDNGYATVKFNGKTESSKKYSVANGAFVDAYIDVYSQASITSGSLVKKEYHVTILRAPAITAFSATPKVGSCAELSPGGDNVMTFKWKQIGIGDETLDVSADGITWQNIDSETDLGYGTFELQWNGSVGGTPLVKGTYKARIQITDEFGTSSYHYLNFKIMGPPTVTLSAPSPATIQQGGTQKTTFKVTWNIVSNIKVEVYDSLNHLVAIIYSDVNQYAKSKTLTWDGKYDAGHGGGSVAAGPYTIRATAGTTVQEKPVTVE